MTQPTDPVPAPDARLKAAATRLRQAATTADHDVKTKHYWSFYNPATAWHDGLVNGFGGRTGDYAALMSPAVGGLVAQLLEERAQVARHAPGAGSTVTDRVALALADAILGDDDGAEPAAAPRTPCSAPECNADGNGEPCDRHETEQAHAAGDHQFCGLECSVTLPSEQLRNAILCQAIPGSPAMLAELERRAAAQAPAPVLSYAERTFLAFALDLAFDKMVSDDGFTDDDNAAYDSLRKLASGEEQDEPTNADMFSASELHDMDRADEYAMDADDDAPAGGEQA